MSTQERIDALVKEVQAANARAAAAESRNTHRESASYHLALDEVIRLRRQERAHRAILDTLDGWAEDQ